MADQKLTFTLSGREQGVVAATDAVVRATDRATASFERAQQAATGSGAAISTATERSTRAATQHAAASERGARAAQEAAAAARAQAEALRQEAAAAERAVQKAEQLVAKRREQAEAARRAFDAANKAAGGDPSAVDPKFDRAITRADQLVDNAVRKADEARRVAAQADLAATVAEGKAKGAALAANGLASELASGHAQRAQAAAGAVNTLATAAQGAATAEGQLATATEQQAGAAQRAAQASAGLAAAVGDVVDDAAAAAGAVKQLPPAQAAAAQGFDAMSAAARRTEDAAADAQQASQVLADATDRDARAAIRGAGARERQAVSARLAAQATLQQRRAEQSATEGTTRFQRATDATRAALERVRGTFRSAGADADGYSATQRGAASAADALTRRVVALVAGVVSLTAALRFVGTGIAFNEQLEASTFGIATLISAQAKLTDANGKQLTGVKALEGAYGLAERQVTALRIAGLKTAAETPQLLEAFQQATGAGLAAGLNLDQIRQITVGVTQAAANLGVPMVQLNQEVRSILDGTIDVNSRVAKALNITSAQVRVERERGTLAAFLLQKFEQFNIAAERGNGLLRIQKSNLQEALGVFAGEATRPLFESLKGAANDALTDAFEVDGATVGPKFQPLLELAQRIFGAIGTMVTNAISGGIAGAQALGRYFREHREELLGVAAAAGDVLRAVLLIISETAKFAGAIARALVESGLLAGVLRTVAQAITIAWQTAKVLAVVLAGVAIALSPILIQLAAVAAAGAIAAAPLTALLIGIAAIAVVVNSVAAAQENARKKQEALNAAQAAAIHQAPALIEEYRQLAKQLESGALKGEALKQAQERVKTIKAELIALSPDFRRALDDETKSLTQQAAEAARVREELRKNGEEKRRAAEADVAALENRLADLTREQATATGRNFERISGEIAGVTAQLNTARTSLAALRKAFGDTARDSAFADVVGGSSSAPVLPGLSSGGTGDPTGKAKNDAQQKARAEIEEAKKSFATQKALLDVQLDASRISYARYFDDLAAAYRQSYDRQQAALARLLAATSDEGEREQILARTRELEDEKVRIAAESGQRRVELEQRLRQQVADAEVQLLRSQGREAEARARELERTFGDLIRRLVAEGDAAGLRIVRALFNTELVQAELAQVDTEVGRFEANVQRSLDDIERRRAQGLISGNTAQRERVAVYQVERAELVQLRDAYEGFAMVTADQNALDFLDALDDKIRRVDTDMAQASETFGRFGVLLEDSVRGNLAEFLGSTINQVEDLADGLRQLVLSVVQDIQRALGQIVSREVVDQLKQLFGLGRGGSAGEELGASAARLGLASIALSGAGGAVQRGGLAVAQGAAALGSSALLLMTAAGMLQAANLAGAAGGGGGNLIKAIAEGGAASVAIGFAGGGAVSGPGTSTSDSILARLSNLEFVQPAVASQYYGVGVMEAIRQRRIPREFLRSWASGSLTLPARRNPLHGLPGFASGGAVRAPQGVSGAGAAMLGGGTLDGSLTVGVQPDAVVRDARAFLRSSKGREEILRIVIEERETLLGGMGISRGRPR